MGDMKRLLAMTIVLVLALTGCAATAGAVTPASLKLPDSVEPTAGACAETQGAYAVVQVNPDVPSPRCQKVGEEQKLQVVNNTEQTVKAHLGQVDLTVGPHQEATASLAFGQYLVPGVHRLAIVGQLETAVELWLRS
ncbi:MAG: hypothetical protein M1401_08970 [Chloroflexi bacterium]|nr:hypothetical protein [Chloroflexota bacterium]